MLPLQPGSEPIRLKLAKQMFRDGWLLSRDKEEYGEIRFGSLRLKASGKSTEGEYDLKKDKLRYSVLKAGQEIAWYEGKTEGRGGLAGGSEFSLHTERTDTTPGSIRAGLIDSAGQVLVWIDTTWNSLGVPHCDLIVEPAAPSGDRLWGLILVLLRVVVEHGLWNVSRDAAYKMALGSDAVRRLLG